MDRSAALIAEEAEQGFHKAALFAAWKTQVAVLKGVLFEAEQDQYVRRAAKRSPISVVEKVILDVRGDHVDVSCTLHRFRDLRKMGLSEDLERWLKAQKKLAHSKYIIAMEDHKLLMRSSYRSLWRLIERELPEKHKGAKRFENGQERSLKALRL